MAQRPNRKRKFCRFTALGVKEIDYKDLDTLKGYISETGRMSPVETPGQNPVISAVIDSD
ncbi:MAG: hypothetical protein CM1200mP41_32900 [Gammaproteobacteria bacterium]|nr:MAG: hypothetical protein CM1200mP41_32900 [Gammaproteobacteria bacterium]